MDQFKKLLYVLLLPAALMLATDSRAVAQSGATINVVSHSCSSYGSAGSCDITVSWDDPSNPDPVDYVTQSEPQLGTWTVAEGDSGEYTAYNVTIYPVAFQLYDAQGDWLAAVWCYSNGNNSIECE